VATADDSVQRWRSSPVRVPVLLALDLIRTGYLPNGLNGAGQDLACMAPPADRRAGNRAQVTPTPSAPHSGCAGPVGTP